MKAMSALYFGEVMHRRTRPKPHKLRYRVFSLLLDLDEMPRLSSSLRLFAYNRAGIFSFHDRDHLAGSHEPLRDQIMRELDAAGVAIPGGSIQIFCMPRIFGYVFNPLSVYFCRRADHSLAAILYEVNNTFGERHSYLIAVHDTGEVVHQSCNKELYVSPFMPMSMRYDFRVRPPAESVSIAIHGRDEAGLLISACQNGQRADLSDRNLARALFALPVLTLKVVAGIHWEALKLWRKGVRLVPRPSPPAKPVTIVSRTGAQN